jgi:hypothetical protein
MSFAHWLSDRRWMSSRTGGMPRQPLSSTRTRPAQRNHRLCVESLEERRLMSAPFIVTTALDEFDGGTAANAAGSDGQLSLREAIGAASSGDRITFAPSLKGSTIQLDSAKGELLINQDLNIIGLGAANLAVSGENATGVFSVAVDTTVSISGLTIENGFAYDFSGDISGFYGGGIFSNGNLTLGGCTLSSNSALSGGGIYCNYGSLMLSGCTLSGNSASVGGGIYNAGTLTVTGSALTANHATDQYGYGGGIVNEGIATVIGSVISDNSASYNGGGFADFGPLTLSGSTLSGNSAPFGGGIYTFGGGAIVTVTDFSDISDNSASYGGGILNTDFGTLTVTNASTISDNTAGAGGGIANSEATVTVSNASTISGNSASRGDGGGINNYDGTVTITDSTVCGNSVVWGRGADIYYTGGTLTLSNSDVCIVNLPSSITTVTNSSATSIIGEAVTFTATVGVFGGSSSTGAILFVLDGSKSYGPLTLDASGQATLTVAGLPAGTHTVTATYSGDVSTVPSTSAVFTQTVLSAQQELGAITYQVKALVSTGILASGKGNALIAKLNNAIVSLNGGNTITCVNQLDAFINQTNAFLETGKIDSIDALTLIADIDLAIAAALAKPI